MSTHTIQDELTQLANSLGISVSGAHNIKDVIRKMSQAHGGNSNGRAIADAIKNMKAVLPFPIADPPSAFSIGHVTFTPSFDDDVYAYVGAVDGENESGALTFTKATGTDVTITFNGDEVETGDTLEFVNGANVLVATVTQEGVSPVTYTVTFPFQRVAKDLTALAITNVTLDPAFAAGEYEFDGTVSAGEFGGTLTFTAASNNSATAKFNGTTVESGDALTFVDGANTVTITVTREDSDPKEYEIDIDWTRPSAADLTALAITNVTLDPTFAGSTYTYAGTVADSETSGVITVTAAANTTATITFNGTDVDSGDSLTFVDGTNTVVVTVSRENYTDTIYTITIPFSES